MYETITKFEVLHEAYRHCRSLKRYKQEVLFYSFNIERNLVELAEDLAARTYKHGKYREFIVNDSKKRLIRAAPFRDRIVHKAVCMMIEPLFDKIFIADSYACRVDKGTHAALNRLEGWLKGAEKAGGGSLQGWYILQCDISAYFATIDHDILYSLICRRVREPEMQKVIRQIIDSHKDTPGKGVPIGNLTSQLFANIYLNELDQFVKHTLRERYYIRYMDDFLILSNDKHHLHKIKKEIEVFVRDKLALTLHPRKAIIAPAQLPITFLGYVLHGSKYRHVRRSSVKRFQKRFARQQRLLDRGQIEFDKVVTSVVSWDAYAKHARTYRLRERLYRG